MRYPISGNIGQDGVVKSCIMAPRVLYKSGMKDRVLGNYRVLKEIGAGGMAHIYLAVHQDIPSLKVILKIVSDPQLAVRFKNEAEKLALLDGHSSVCKIKHFFNHGHDFVIAMEYIEGETLEHKIKSAGTLKAKEAIQITSDLLDVLAFAHERGVYHRDIKPSNIMFDTHGNLKIIDFGIAKGETDPSLTGVDVYVGTPAYMAPEQFSTNKDHNWAKADIYAVGTTLYEMLTGERPFKGDDLFILRDAKVFSKPPKPRSLRPEISKHLENVILTALDKDPAKRFENVQEMKEALMADPRRYSYTIQGVKTTVRHGNKAKIFGITAAILIALGAAAYFAVPGVPEWVDAQIERLKGPEPVTPVALLPPPLLFPADGGALAENEPHVFGWAPVTGAQDGYRVEIASDTSFETITVSQRQTQTQYRLPSPLGAGDYYWRVTAVGAAGSPGATSDARRVSVKAAEQVPGRGRVIIASNLAGDLYINDQLYQSNTRRVELPLDQGTHTIRMDNSSSSEKSISETLTISGDTTIVQDFTFTRPAFSTLRVSSRPPGANVLVDGKVQRGVKTPAEITLSPGSHTIGVQVDNGSPEYRTIDLSPNVDTNLFVNLRYEEDQAEISRLQQRIASMRSAIPAGMRSSSQFIDAEDAFTRAEVSRRGEDYGSAISAYSKADTLFAELKQVHDQRDGEVRAALERLRSSFENRNTDDMADVYPGIPQQERDGWKQFFESAKNLRVDFSIDRVDISTAEADARISVRMMFEDRQGKKDQQFSWQVKLEEQNGRWLVVQRETN